MIYLLLVITCIGWTLVGAVIGLVAGVLLYGRYGFWQRAWLPAAILCGALWPIPVGASLAYMAYVWFKDGIRELD